MDPVLKELHKSKSALSRNLRTQANYFRDEASVRRYSNSDRQRELCENLTFKCQRAQNYRKTTLRIETRALHLVRGYFARKDYRRVENPGPGLVHFPSAVGDEMVRIASRHFVLPESEPSADAYFGECLLLWIGWHEVLGPDAPSIFEADGDLAAKAWYLIGEKVMEDMVSA